MDFEDADDVPDALHRHVAERRAACPADMRGGDHIGSVRADCPWPAARTRNCRAPRRPSSRYGAATKAASSTTAPRAVLTRKAVGLHQGQSFRIDQVMGLRDQRAVKAVDIGFLQNLGEITTDVDARHSPAKGS